MEKLLIAIEVATTLGVSRSEVFVLWKRELLPSVRFGKSIRCVPSDLAAFIEAHRSRVNENLPDMAVSSKFKPVTPFGIGDHHV